MDSYSIIEDIYFVDSDLNNKDKHLKLFNNDFFTNSVSTLENSQVDLRELRKNISSPLKKRMSELSLGICHALNSGPLTHIKLDDEIYLFTAFAEIETTRQIIESIKIDKENLVSPTLFHNSVHNTPLGYFTIINKLHNYATTISDGLSTNSSFIDFMEYNTKLQNSFIVAAGEESSKFYELDKTTKKNIQSAFIAYKVVNNTDSGFVYRGNTNSLDKLLESQTFNKCKYIFANNENIFDKIDIQNITDKNFIFDYPLLKDNPTAIVFRLALPFYFNIQSPSLVIEKIGEIYHYFEIRI